MANYLAKMKLLIDELSFSACKISEEDQVINYIGGLGIEYDAIIVNVLARIGSVQVKEVRSLLLNQKSRLNKHH